MGNWARLHSLTWTVNIDTKADPSKGSGLLEINGRLSDGMHGRLLAGFDEMVITMVHAASRS